MADNECGCGSCGLGWFLAGLGIGAVIGVLYAPMPSPAKRPARTS